MLLRDIVVLSGHVAVDLSLWSFYRSPFSDLKKLPRYKYTDG
jgi:hypothetical protein